LKISGLALSPNTVVYYYTYASVLAALSRPQENHCAEARQVFSEVGAQFGSDRDIAGIIAAGEAICTGVEEGNAPSSGGATPVDLGTGTPAAETPQPTATP
jgi:hypothetical protein